MADYQQSSLWRRTLGGESIPEHDQAAVAKLRSAYEDFRSKVEPMAGEISLSMPMFTDHSIVHIDSLWDTASLIIGEKFPINPAEAFVLGGAFLLHDLGMGLVAFPDGVESIRNDPLFDTFVEASIDRSRRSSPGLDQEAVRSDAEDEAIVTVLRLRHARQAERLVSQQFTTSNKETFRLLENTELRSAFGPLIGRIAHSHWFDVDELQATFPNVLGSHPSHPPSWEVDSLKLACILRLADAIHIDSRRAPTYLHAFRKPTGISRDHWYFQERLTRPRLEGDRLIYTATQPFSAEDAQAWWLAYETLQMIDGELHRVDALCVDSNRPRFLAQAVAGADSPRRLANFIEPSGWDPVDARVRVTQVESVVSNLGGRELYGNSPMVAIRELVSNAADSVRARQLQFGGSENDVVVRIWESDGQHWISVSDHGIGMDQSRIVSSLTDFGNSGWMSAQTLTEYPKLVGKEYRSTGRFGIGFFSVFMLGSHVEVRSLKALEAADKTSKLVFENGLASRPVLHRVDPDDYMFGGGTEVRVRLDLDPLTRKGLLGTETLRNSRAEMFESRLRHLCALTDVNIGFADSSEDNYRVIVSADQWKTASAGHLFKMIYADELENPLTAPMYREYEHLFERNLRNIIDERGDVIGRAILIAGFDDVTTSDIWWWPTPRAGVYVGGMYADSIWSVMGVFVGEPQKADRNSAFPSASIETLRSWVAQQVTLIDGDAYATIPTRYRAAQLARSVGVEVPTLPMGYTHSGEVTPATVDAWVETQDSILIFNDIEMLAFHNDDGSPFFLDKVRGRELTLPTNAIVVDLYNLWFFPEDVAPRPTDSRFSEYGELIDGVWNPKHWWYTQEPYSAARFLIESASRVWNCSVVSLGESSKRLELHGNTDSRVDIRCADGSFAKIEAYMITRS